MRFHLISSTVYAWIVVISSRHVSLIVALYMRVLCVRANTARSALMRGTETLTGGVVALVANPVDRIANIKWWDWQVLLASANREPADADDLLRWMP